MTIAHWAAGTIAAAAALSTLTIVAAEREIPETQRAAWNALSERRWRLEARLDRANDRLDVARVHDSIGVLLRGREWPADSLLVISDPGVDSALIAANQLRLQKLWRALRPRKGAVRVAVRLDRGRWWRASRVLLPDAADGRTCVVSVGARRFMVGTNGRSENDTSLVVPNSVEGRTWAWQTGRPLDVCAFYAAFGHPGPGIRAWLDSVEFAPARVPNFWSPSEEMSPWSRPSWDPDAGFALSATAKVFGNIQPNFAREADIVRCAAGQEGTCARWALSIVADSQRGAPVRGMPVSVETNCPCYVGDRVFSDPKPRMLADLVRAIGRDRFRRFWTSALPVESAFAEATGTSLESGMFAYVRTSIGGPAFIGPDVQIRPVLSGLALSAVALLLAASRFSRREHR